MGVSKRPCLGDLQCLGSQACDLRKRVCRAGRAQLPCGIREEVRVHSSVLAGLMRILTCGDAEGGGTQWWRTFAPLRLGSGWWDRVRALTFPRATLTTSRTIRGIEGTVDRALRLHGRVARRKQLACVLPGQPSACRRSLTSAPGTKEGRTGGRCPRTTPALSRLPRPRVASQWRPQRPLCLWAPPSRRRNG